MITSEVYRHEFFMINPLVQDNLRFFEIACEDRVYAF